MFNDIFFNNAFFDEILLKDALNGNAWFKFIDVLFKFDENLFKNTPFCKALEQLENRKTLFDTFFNKTFFNDNLLSKTQSPPP